MSDQRPNTSPERAIRLREQDRLERGRFTERLVDAVIERRTKRATGVVIGITGPWGSGKSSVLNLLAEQIARSYHNALVVRFDPWLVHGRDSLISLFLREFLTELDARSAEGSEWRKAAVALADYAEALAKPAKELNGFAGSLLSLIGWLSRRYSHQDQSVHALRQRLETRLKQVRAPIVVLIDELDRVEDIEVRTVAQLVRAIIDFPGVSYVLAYDYERVIEALGSVTGLDRVQSRPRGQAYLEKIVQFAIPLPAAERSALQQLLLAELAAVGASPEETQSPAEQERFREVLDLGLSGLTTPRDIKRAVGHFRVLDAMLRGEVTRGDLFGFAVLSAKAPDTVEQIRSDPEAYVDDPLSESEHMRRLSRDGSPAAGRDLVPPNLRRLFDDLFPAASGQRSDGSRSTLSIARRRSLLTVLRLGLTQGEIPRPEIEELLQSTADQARETLRGAVVDNRLGEILDRVYDIYPLFTGQNSIGFWVGAADFLAPQADTGVVTFLTIRNSVDTFTRILISNARFRRSARVQAETIVRTLATRADPNLLADILRLHFFMYGLYGRRNDGSDAAILSREEVESLTIDQISTWRTQLISGELLPKLSNLDSLFAILETGNWGEEEKAAISRQILDTSLLDRLVLMMFGERHVLDDSYVEQLVGRERFIEACRHRLNELGSEPSAANEQAIQQPEASVTALRHAYARAVRGSEQLE